MGRMSLDTQSHVIYLYQGGWKLKDIQSHLKSEVFKTSLCLSIQNGAVLYWACRFLAAISMLRRSSCLGVVLWPINFP